MTFYSRQAALILKVSQIPLTPAHPRAVLWCHIESILSLFHETALPMFDSTDRILTFASITFYIPCLLCCLILLTLISSEQ